MGFMLQSAKHRVYGTFFLHKKYQRFLLKETLESENAAHEIHIR